MKNIPSFMGGYKNLKIYSKMPIIGKWYCFSLQRKYMRSTIFSIALFAGLGVMDTSVLAAQFQTGVTRDNISYLTVHGEIAKGDSTEFNRIVSSFRNENNPIKIVYLNSPGGDVPESLSMTITIVNEKLNTAVPDGWECVSACVLIFGGGLERHAFPNSTIAVHRISVDNSDTERAKALSVDLASAYEYLDFPSNVTLKMLTTPPNKIYELTPEEKVEISSNSANITQLASTLTNGGVSSPIVAITPNDRALARELNNSSIKLINKGQYRLAIQKLEQAKNLFPADAEVLGNLGYAYFNTGDYDIARSNLTAALKLKPKRSVSWNNLGQTLGAQNQVEWAADCFQKYWEYTANKTLVNELFDSLEVKYKNSNLDGVYQAVKLAKNRLGLNSQQ